MTKFNIFFFSLIIFYANYYVVVFFEESHSYFSVCRLYDAKSGRFIQADTLVPDSTSQRRGRYSYAYNSPIKYTDPTGHIPFVQDPNQTNRASGQASEVQTGYDWRGRLIKLGGDLVDMAADTAEFVAKSLLPPSSETPKEVVSQEIYGPEQFAPVMTFKEFSILTFGMVTPKVPGGAGDDLAQTFRRARDTARPYVQLSKVEREAVDAIKAARAAKAAKDAKLSPEELARRRREVQSGLSDALLTQSDKFADDLEAFLLSGQKEVMYGCRIPHQVITHVRHLWYGGDSNFKLKRPLLSNPSKLRALERDQGQLVRFIYRKRMPGGTMDRRQIKVFETWSHEEIEAVKQTMRHRYGS